MGQDSKPHFNVPAPSVLAREISFELEENGLSDADMKALVEKVSAARVTTSSPYFMNQLFAGVRPEMLEAEKFIAESRTTLATYEASGPFTMMELETIRALSAKIGWEDDADGIVVPGGSAANFMAIHCARAAKSEDFRKWGNSKEWKVFATRESHYSLEKAVLALGLGLDSLVTVATDKQGRMSPEALLRSIQDLEDPSRFALIVIATAGTTVRGAFDPIDEIAKVCEGYGIWLHVDGAWGGPALFTDKLSPQLKGLSRATSFTFDAHKLLGSDLTCSLFLSRHSDVLLAANDVHGGEYLFHETSTCAGLDQPERYDRGRRAWQCGRRPEIFSFWSFWKRHGSSGIGRMIDEKLKIRDEVLRWIANQPRLKLLYEPTYLNLCVQVLPPDGASLPASTSSDSGRESPLPAWSKHVREVLKAEGHAFVNYSTRNDGTTFLRLILAHHALETRHVREILEAALSVK